MTRHGMAQHWKFVSLCFYSFFFMKVHTWKIAHSFSCLNSTSTPGLPYSLTTPDLLPIAMIFCNGSKAKAVGLFGKPCFNVNSAVNCSDIKDSMMSCSSLAGPEAPAAPLLPEPEVGEGELTLCLKCWNRFWLGISFLIFKSMFCWWKSYLRLSMTPLIETNLFILFDMLSSWLWPLGLSLSPDEHNVADHNDKVDWKLTTKSLWLLLWPRTDSST